MNLTKEEYKHLKFDMHHANDLIGRSTGNPASRTDFNAGFEAGIEWAKRNPPPPAPPDGPEPRKVGPG